MRHPICLFALALASCSGRQRTPAQHARITIEAAAHGLAAVDAVVAERIQRDASEPHEPGAIHVRWHGTVEALEHTHTALVLAERAVDTYTAARGSACPAYLAVLAVQDSTGELTGRLRVAGIAIPETFTTTLVTLTSAARQLAPRCADGGVL